MTFTSTSTDPEGQPLTIEWDFYRENGVQPSEPEASGSPVSIDVPNEAGVQVEMRATDPDGEYQYADKYVQCLPPPVYATINPGSSSVELPLEPVVKASKPIQGVAIYRSDGALVKEMQGSPYQEPGPDGLCQFAAAIDYLPLGDYVVRAETADYGKAEATYKVVGYRPPSGFKFHKKVERRKASTLVKGVLSYLASEPRAVVATVSLRLERCRPVGARVAAGRRSCRKTSGRWRRLGRTVRS